MKGLEELRKDFEIVGDVRGKGLMIGVEMVTDKASKNPLPADRMVDIWYNLFNNHNIFPFVFVTSDLDFFELQRFLA